MHILPENKLGGAGAHRNCEEKVRISMIYLAGKWGKHTGAVVRSGAVELTLGFNRAGRHSTVPKGTAQLG